MSNWETTPVQPTPATQQDVIYQIEQLRRQLQDQIRQARQAAADQAAQRANEIHLEQIVRIQGNIDALDDEMRKVFESMDEKHREQLQKQVDIIQGSIKSLDKTTRENLEAMDRRHRQQLQQISKSVYDDIGKAQKEMQNRVNRQLKDLASDVSAQMKGLDTKIQQQQREIHTINEQMQVVVNDINDMAKSIDKRFEEDEQQIATIQDDLADIRKHFQDEDELARQTVATAKALLDVVEKRTLLDRFAPDNEAEDVRKRVEDLSKSSLHGAALTAKAEETITQIQQTERHAVKEKAKHDALVEVAMTQVEKVLAVVNENREIEQEVEGGDPMKVECDFWSEGEYGRLEEELEDLKKELKDRYNDKLTEERVQAILKRSAEIEGRIMQIGAESVAKAILSEVRVETVDDIVNAMKKKGWMLKGESEGNPESNYMGGEKDHDWRKGVFAVLENNLGEEITIIVDPVSLNQNQLIVHQETSGKSEQEVQQQMEAIKQQLSESGFPVGETTSGVAQIPEMGSAKSLGKAHATDNIRQKVQQ